MELQALVLLLRRVVEQAAEEKVEFMIIPLQH